jgi:hypothetical protein
MRQMIVFKYGTRLWTSLAMLVFLSFAAVSCSLSAPLAVPAAKAGPSAQGASTPAASAGNTASTVQPDQSGQKAVADNSTDNITPAVRILQVHFRGSLQPLGCCNNQLFEKDEFVAIQNTGKTIQDISGWKLVNATKGYAPFIFPSYFPCIAFSPYQGNKYAANVQNYASNTPQTIEEMFSSGQTEQAHIPIPSQVNWSSCQAPEPLDETPMIPLKGQPTGQLSPCVLYPGQIVLIFTDEIHCQYGGLSFRYGLGNLWDNEIPDTAVLYDSEGKEVSRRSYTLGR